MTFIAWCIGAMMAHAQTTIPFCKVDVSTPGVRLLPFAEGSRLEEFNHQFEGGPYAQLIDNPSFEELANPIAQWSLIQRGSSKGALDRKLPPKPVSSITISSIASDSRSPPWLQEAWAWRMAAIGESG